MFHAYTLNQGVIATSSRAAPLRAARVDELRIPRNTPYHRASQRELVRMSLALEMSRDVYPLRGRVER